MFSTSNTLRSNTRPLNTRPTTARPTNVRLPNTDSTNTDSTNTDFTNTDSSHTRHTRTRPINFTYNENTFPTTTVVVSRPAGTLDLNPDLYATKEDAQHHFSPQNKPLEPLNMSDELDEYLVEAANGTTVELCHKEGLSQRFSGLKVDKKDSQRHTIKLENDMQELRDQFRKLADDSQNTQKWIQEQDVRLQQLTENDQNKNVQIQKQNVQIQKQNVQIQKLNDRDREHQRRDDALLSHQIATRAAAGLCRKIWLMISDCNKVLLKGKGIEDAETLHAVATGQANLGTPKKVVADQVYKTIPGGLSTTTTSAISS